MLALRNRSRDWLSPRLMSGLMLVLICCLVLLEGCGFRLRGSIGGDLALPPLYIDSSGSNAFVSGLTQALARTKTTVVDERAAAELIIGIGAERLDRRVLTVDASGRIQEYELLYAVSFAVNDTSARVVLGTQTISLRRSFEFSDINVLAKESEEAQLYRDMRRSAVQNAMRRLQALAAKLAVHPAQSQALEPVDDRQPSAPDADVIDKNSTIEVAP